METQRAWQHLYPAAAGVPTAPLDFVGPNVTWPDASHSTPVTHLSFRTESSE
ncbi:MAG: hypothetical protein H6657_30040 [Ardenticatenaceae bacterium]|nr:hypothetical protein [Ardenticatenaceae bacterium]